MSLFKNLLTVSTSLLFSSHAFADSDAKVLTLGQKSRLTQLCLEGQFTGEDGNASATVLNQVLGSKIRGDSSMGAPQGHLLISDGKGRYTFIELSSQSYFANETLKKGQNFDLARKSHVSQITYAATTVEQGVVTKTELAVSDYSLGRGNSDFVQFCRVGLATSFALKDQIADVMTTLLTHRDIFSQSKTQAEAEAALEKISRSGKTKLSSKELSVVKDILFKEYWRDDQQNKSETSSLSNSLIEYAYDIRSRENLIKLGDASTSQEVQKVAVRGEEVKTMNLNIAAMNSAVLKVGFEVIGKKVMSLGENDLVEDNGYRASGAKTHSLLRMAKDRRALDILIVK